MKSTANLPAASTGQHVAPVASDALTPLSETELQARLDQAAHDGRGTDSAGTIRTYGAGVSKFVAWCDQTGQPYGMPVHPRQLAAFVDDMAETMRPNTIATYVHAINRMHRDLDLPLPAGARVVQQAMRRMRLLPQNVEAPPKQAVPLTRDQIETALRQFGTRPIDLRDAALISLAHDTLARASELVAFNVKDIQPGEDGGTALIRRSKTDQEGDGDFRFVAPDTLARVAAWVEAMQLEPGDALFPTLSTRDAADRISPRDVSRIYKRRMGQAFSGHSTRVGAAVDQRAAGITTGEIAQSGGWKGDAMPARYTRQVAPRFSGAAKLARLQGRA